MLNKLFFVSILLVIVSFGMFEIVGNAKIPVNRIELKSVIKWSKNCEDAYLSSLSSGTIFENQGIKWYKVNNNNWILQIQCDQAAYQGVYEFFEVLRNNNKIFLAEKIKFATKTKNPVGEITDYTKYHLLGNPIVITSPKVRIKNLEKARGLGDCGIYEEFSRSWTFSLYRAKVVRVQDECDGNTDIMSWESYL
jgi:Protein of unknown function (DUF1176)